MHGYQQQPTTGYLQFSFELKWKGFHKRKYEAGEKTKREKKKLNLIKTIIKKKQKFFNASSQRKSERYSFSDLCGAFYRLCESQLSVSNRIPHRSNDTYTHSLTEIIKEYHGCEQKSKNPETTLSKQKENNAKTSVERRE